MSFKRSKKSALGNGFSYTKSGLCNICIQLLILTFLLIARIFLFTDTVMNNKQNKYC
jgi:hypothetical protein